MKVSEYLKHASEALAHVAGLAGALDNKNLADIIESGRAKIAQAAEHPDAEALDVEGPEDKPDPKPDPAPPAELKPSDDPAHNAPAFNPGGGTPTPTQ